MGVTEPEPARTRADLIFDKISLIMRSFSLYVDKRLDIIHEDNYQKGRELLIRIIMMLTKLAQKTN